MRSRPTGSSSGADRGSLQFAAAPRTLIKRDVALFRASLRQASVMVSCASAREDHDATASSGKSSLAMTRTDMTLHKRARPSFSPTLVIGDWFRVEKPLEQQQYPAWY